jgi:hypothetical protein
MMAVVAEQQCSKSHRQGLVLPQARCTLEEAASLTTVQDESYSMACGSPQGVWSRGEGGCVKR